MRAKISYGIPFYYRNSWVCYLNPLKKSMGVELAFTRANEITDPTGLLQHKGRKQVAGIELQPNADIPWQALDEVMQAALRLDDTTKYNVKKT